MVQEKSGNNIIVNFAKREKDLFLEWMVWVGQQVDEDLNLEPEDLINKKSYNKFLKEKYPGIH